MYSIIQQAIDNFDLSDIINTTIIVILLAVIVAQSRIRIVFRSNKTNFY